MSGMILAGVRLVRPWGRDWTLGHRSCPSTCGFASRISLLAQQRIDHLLVAVCQFLFSRRSPPILCDARWVV